MKKFLLVFLSIIIILIALVLIRTFTYPFKKTDQADSGGWKFVKNDSVVKRFSDGLKIPTVSTGELGDFDYSPFVTFKEYLKKAYPEVY